MDAQHITSRVGQCVNCKQPGAVKKSERQRLRQRKATLLLVEVKAAAVVKVVGIESCGWSVNESGSKAVASLVILCR